MNLSKKGMFNVPAFNFAIVAVLFLMVFILILGLSARTNAQLRATAVSSGANANELSIYDNGTIATQQLAGNTSLITTVIVVVIVLLLLFLVIGSVAMGGRN